MNSERAVSEQLNTSQRTVKELKKKQLQNSSESTVKEEGKNVKQPV